MIKVEGKRPGISGISNIEQAISNVEGQGTKDHEIMSGKGKNESKSGVYSCSPREIDEAGISQGKFVANLKKQSQSPACGRKSEARMSKSETRRKDAE